MRQKTHRSLVICRLITQCKETSWMLPCKGVDWWTWANLRNAIFITARAADCRSLVMVAAKYFLILRNVLGHRSR